ncbi:MAG: sigma-70 family RNA polymerase sigma factor [Candidatus Omnitrophota bacterium]
MKEQELIQRCLNKDLLAWNIFIDKYSKLIYWAIKKRLTKFGFQFNQDDINTIFQEVFVVILEKNKLSQLDNAEFLPGWLAMIASNKASDFLRESALKDKYFVSDIEPFQNVYLSENSSNSQLNYVIKEIINTLSNKEKIIISLNLLEGRTHREIAHALSLSVNTVSTVIARTKQKLKKELKEIGF